MGHRKNILKLSELPRRSKLLNPVEYEKVFGGRCKEKGEHCDCNDHCCSGLKCSEIHGDKCIEE